MFGHLNHNTRFTMDFLCVQFHSTIKQTIFFNLIFFFDYFSKVFVSTIYFTVSVIPTTISPMISRIIFASIRSIIISIFFRLGNVSRETFL